MAKLHNDTEKVKTKSELNNENINEEESSDSSVNSAIDLQSILGTLQALQSEIEGLKKTNRELEDKAAKHENVSINRYDYDKNSMDRVKIRLNAHVMLHAELPSLNLRMTEFGESRTITLSEFQQLIGLHPDWFKKEYLLIDASRMDLMEDYPVTAYDSNSSQFIHNKDLKQIGQMDTTELRDYFNKLSPQSKQAFIIMWMRKCYDEDPDFYTIEKMEAVNSMSRSKTFNVLIRKLNEKNDEHEA